jgi:hypothetical protein
MDQCGKKHLISFDSDPRLQVFRFSYVLTQCPAKLFADSRWDDG